MIKDGLYDSLILFCHISAAKVGWINLIGAIIILKKFVFLLFIVLIQITEL